MEDERGLVMLRMASRGLPPVLLGRETAAVGAKVRSFYAAVAEIFER